MHQIRFRDPSGYARTGSWTGDEVVFADRSYTMSEVDILPPCEPSKVVCVGRNYEAHAHERGEQPPQRPHLFLKPPSALAGHGDRVVLPEGARVDPEAELGVVIGTQCRHVDRSEALGVVAGFTCVNDVSNRTEQDQEQNWVRGKAFDNACPIGPVLASVDAVGEDARVVCRVNGGTRQDAPRSSMIFPVPVLIEAITRHMTLEPGDVIATGTPEGVAPIEDGDRVEVEVEGVGVLENTVTREG